MAQAMAVCAIAEVKARRQVEQDLRNGVLFDGNATAAGMNRLVDGENVKDTVKK